MSQVDLLGIIQHISTTIREEGSLGDYKFEWKSTSKDKECLIFNWKGNQIAFGDDNCLLKYWTDNGLQYKLYHRYYTEEERFQRSLLNDNVFTSDCEDALAVLVRNLFAYLRDGMYAYREELYEKGLD